MSAHPGAEPANILGTWEGRLVVDAPFPDHLLMSAEMARDFLRRGGEGIGTLPLLAPNGDEILYVPERVADQRHGIIEFVRARIRI